VGGGEGGKVHCAERMYFYSVHTNTHEKGDASHKSPNVQKLLFFCFVHFVLLHFVIVYVVCCLHFLTFRFVHCTFCDAIPFVTPNVM
jgi:hypothetical protein